MLLVQYIMINIIPVFTFTVKYNTGIMVLYQVRLDLWVDRNAPLIFHPFVPHPSLYLIILIAILLISITL